MDDAFLHLMALPFVGAPGEALLQFWGKIGLLLSYRQK
jgi:hypothetical protein